MSSAPHTDSVEPAGHAAWGPALCAGLVLAVAGCYPVWTADLFGHLAAGRQIAELGRVPDFDTFSFYFDEPRPWRNHNWTTGLLLWGIYALGGAPALVLTKALLLAATGVLLVRACRRDALAGWLCALVMLWAIPAVRIRFTVRPHLFGLLACAVLVHQLCVLARAGTARLPWGRVLALGALQIAWVNMHGSGPLAFLLTGAFLVGHWGDWPRQRVYLAVLAAQAVGSAVSPWGPAILIESFTHVGSEGTREFIGEWGQLGLGSSAWELGAYAAFAALFAWGAQASWHSGCLGRSALWLSAGLFAMGVRSVRFVDLTLLLGAPFVVHGVALRLERLPRARIRPWLAGLAAAGLAAAPLAAADAPPYQAPGLGVSTRSIPASLGRWLAQHRPQARVAGLMEDCWYLSFAVPRSKVLIDGRQAVYPLEVLQRVSGALRDPRALAALLDERRADAVVLRHNRPEHARSIARLATDPRFSVAAIGDRHVLFVRGLPEREALRVLAPNLGLRSFAPAERERAARELTRNPAGAGAEAYAGMQRALLLLSPSLLSGGQDGLAEARDEPTRARYRDALRALSPALERHDNFVTAQLLAALLHVRLCELDAAERLLGWAREEGENRHTIALAIELAIRGGRREQARRMLGALAADGGTDGWLVALHQALTDNAVCP